MASRVSVAVMLASALALGGCAYTENTLWPALGFQTQGSSSASPSASDLTPATQATKAQPKRQQLAAAPEAPRFTNEAPITGGAPMVEAPFTGGGEIAVNGGSTGTAVGRQVAELQRQLINVRQRLAGQAQQFQVLRQRMVQDSERYHGLVAAIRARLQIGTTPGNPIVIRQWDQAQGALDQLGTDVASMNSLGNEVSDTASSASYILHSVQADFGLSGAVDLDHQRLVELQDATERTQIGINRLVEELNNGVTRQSAYVGVERGNLTQLSSAIKNGQLYGASLGTVAASPVAATSFGASSPTSLAGRQALMIIRFDRANVPYQRQLYNVVSQALKRRPQAHFDLVAVSMGRGSASQVALHQSRSRANVEKVFRSLIAMGLPADRVTLSATTSREVPADEVKLYVR